jgi:hypothetical protein
MIDGFQLQRLDETLSALTDVQGGCERIKNTPLPGNTICFRGFYVPLLRPAALGVGQPRRARDTSDRRSGSVHLSGDESDWTQHRESFRELASRHAHDCSVRND